MPKFPTMTNRPNPPSRLDTIKRKVVAEGMALVAQYLHDQNGRNFHRLVIIDGLEIESRKQNPPSTTSDVPVM